MGTSIASPGSILLVLYRAVGNKSIVHYETSKPCADPNASGALRQWLLSRNHGQWGNEAEDIAAAEEPRRTQHYIRTG